MRATSPHTCSILRAHLKHHPKHLLTATHLAPALMTVAFPSVASAAASAPAYRSPASSAGGDMACSRKALPSAPSKTTYAAPSARRRARARARYQLSAASLVTLRRAQRRPFHVVSSGTCRERVEDMGQTLQISCQPPRLEGGWRCSLQCLKVKTLRSPKIPQWVANWWIIK